ncbi:nitronate monooxygenase family protein [Lysinibacillus irui]|uniref:Probable nitronate monooxygenase n=1 Tax=Lysinibacillus irui TaxID=2998077 RepID=A0ABU5NFF5_9BACI|nr:MULTISPECIES: nitronate monooxygenase family protein [Lysinibacillus]MEA0554284.1 nitronate monooxygenase family protein [Lysinibacillus irui]MEA0561678.1 nitronate monooxygenase family protein [Lysinibacillus irui]MEA0974774.1 nitronate monooxygenase family protein [Lysinibacillus irui]MEA1040928.1 nitronate monooxygenase family protein [Lysinibacillus irui]
MNWNTRVTELLQVKYPIIQGGLAYLAYADLAAAVSNAGGLGQITAMSLRDPDLLREEIHKVRTLTDKPFGVNFAIGMHGKGYEEMVRVAVEEEVPVVTMTGGNPAPIFDLLAGTNIKKLVLVAARRQAQKAEQLGADAVMVVGQEGGGHLGRDDVGTMVLVPQVVDSVKIPVIASGGIGDGRGWMAAHALGAEGIEMGTRFIATKECVDASEAYKEALLASTEADTTIIKRSIGAPARALRNEFTEKILEIEERTPTYEALKEYISGTANKRFIYDGDRNQGFGWAGQVTGMINDIPTVEDLINRMVAEAESIRLKWGH